MARLLSDLSGTLKDSFFIGSSGIRASLVNAATADRKLILPTSHCRLARTPEVSSDWSFSTWSVIAPSSSTTGSPRGAVYFPPAKLWVFLANSSTAPFLCSSDGLFWHPSVSVGSKTWWHICYGAGKLVAVTGDAGNDQQVCYSTNGRDWTLVTSSVINVSRYPWRSVCYSRELGMFCMVGDAGRIMTSPDAITWTFRGQVNTINFYGICYGAGRFVAIGQTGTDRIATSTDGINWTVVSSPVVTDQTWYSICYGNGRFVAVATAGTGTRVMYSTDGLTWTGGVINSSFIMYQICFGAGRFVTIDAGTTTTNKIAHSIDGATWAYADPGVLVTNQFRAICYGNGMFISRYFTSGTNYVIKSGANLIG